MTNIRDWGILVWAIVITLGGLVGFLMDFMIAKGKAPGGVLASMLAGFLGAFLAQWLLGEVIPWNILGVSWLLVLPFAALTSGLYLGLTKLFRFY
ncbi:MAG: hypothetical protein QMD88_07455 [Coprothermobacterota bacterium]|jgi:uncharacterized membrane protein YeaQ/YmgE (transglycosylase-associated protein family)|nr:hypothetical protein [Coprothermobacterota bacterium]